MAYNVRGGVIDMVLSDFPVCYEVRRLICIDAINNVMLRVIVSICLTTQDIRRLIRGEALL